MSKNQLKTFRTVEERDIRDEIMFRAVDYIRSGYRGGFVEALRFARRDHETWTPEAWEQLVTRRMH